MSELFVLIWYACALEFCHLKTTTKDLLETKRTKQSEGHFTSISGHFSANYSKIFQKSEVQTVILRYFVYLYLNFFKSYDIKLVKNNFFSCLKMHYFRAILPKWVLAPPKETSSHIFKIALFSKFFGAFMKHIKR